MIWLGVAVGNLPKASRECKRVPNGCEAQFIHIKAVKTKAADALRASITSKGFFLFLSKKSKNGYLMDKEYTSLNKDLDRILRILVTVTTKVRERLRAEASARKQENQ